MGLSFQPLLFSGFTTGGSSGGGGGGVSSVALALPSSVFTVSGSPVTSSGTLTGSFNVQAANTVFAGPTSGGSTVPSFRALVAADIPSLSYVSSVTASSPLFSSGGSAPNLTIQQANTSQNGFLSSTDWNTFNSKQSALTFGSISTTTTGVTVGAGSNSTVGPNVTINIQNASSTQNGLLTSTDWNTFNSKQPAGSYVTTSEVGAANGVASLDGTGKVPVSQLPSSVLQYEGTWNPSTNTPTLQDSSGTAGYVYWVSAAFAGPISGLNNASMHNFQIGDLVIYNGTQWELTTPAAGVQSVNGSQGVVIVNAINQLTGDVTAGPASGSESEAATIEAIQGNTVSGTTGTGNVVFSNSPTLTGTITAATANFSGAISASNFSGSSSGTNTGDQTITLTGDVTGSGTGSFATTISASAVTLAKMANLPADTIIGNNTNSPATPIALTETQVTAMLNQFTSSLQGVVPGSGGGTTNFLRADGTWAAPTGTGGTVTSVALSDGSTAPIYSITGSPVTSSGTLTFTLNTEMANLVFAGPTSGSAAQPTFRSLVPADLPSISSGLTGILPIANGGTGQSSASAAFIALSPLTTAGDLIYENSTPAPARLPIGTSGQVLTVSGGLPVWASPATSGTVTSVAFADGSSTPIYSISGSPITSSGTITETLVNQSANTFFAGPSSGPAAQPTFRAIVASDIPTLNQNTTGTASNITATSNSTLTTLSSLSLPTTQLTGTLQAAQFPALTGDVTTTAGSLVTHLVATSNSTLTTLSALSLPYSQVTGTPTPLVFADSLVNTSGTVTLVNDTATPGASQYYGTNASSVLGYYALPSISGFANTSLSNLATTSINADLIPNTTYTRNLGSLVDGWSELYVNTISNDGSALAINTPNSSSAGTGNLTWESGQVTAGSGNSGTLTAETGAVVSGNSGALTIETGLSSSGNSGNIRIQSGQASSGTSGTIILQAGSASTIGKIQFLNGSQGTAGQVWTSTDTAGSGSWEAASGGTVTSVSVVTANGFSGTVATATTTPAITLTGTLSGDVTGTLNATTLTAISNSTLTTLSALSLPTSQLTGDISLTSQVSGVLPIANGGTDNGSLSVVAGGILYTDGTKFENVGAGTSGQVLQSNGSSAPSWVTNTPSFSGLTTDGVIYATSSTAVASTAAGTAGYLLTANSSAAPTFSQLNLGTSSAITGTLPVANGGTGDASFTANQVILGGTTSTGILQQVPGGSAGYVLTSNGSTAAPTWQPSAGTTSAFFASSQVTTESAALSSTSFSTFSNSPAFTFTPTISGTYKVYSSVPILLENGTPNSSQIRVINTSGSAVLLDESQANAQFIATTTDMSTTVYVQSVYTLTAGVSYVFDIQGQTNSNNVYIVGNSSPFYMFAELEVAGSGTSPTNTYWSGYFQGGTSNYWSGGSSSFIDPTLTGTATLTTRQVNGITVTPASSNRLGITFTPASASSVYLIGANVTIAGNAGQGVALQLWDGTTQISTASAQGSSGGFGTMQLSLDPDIYAPGTSSPVTVTIQLETSTSTANIQSWTTDAASVEWTLVQIK